MPDALKPVLHIFPANPCRSAYEALAVQHGLNFYPVAVFEGRQCYVHNSYRVHGGKGRGYHDRVAVRFLDTGEHRSVPAGEWAKKAKNP